MRPRSARLLLPAALAALLAASCPAAHAAEAWEADFNQSIASQDSNVQYVAVKKLDPSHAKARSYLYAVLDKYPWYLRQGAIDVLAGASGDAADALAKDMRGHKSPLVREGIVYAFAQMKDPARIADLIAALEDKQGDVRRAAASGILARPTKDGVSAIIDAWGREKDWKVAVSYKGTLEKLTNSFFGWRIEDWKSFWEKKKGRWKPPKAKEGEAETPDAPEPPAEGEGKEKPEELTTTMRDVELTIKESGKGGPLFVVPDIGRTAIYFEDHLQSLESVARLYYIELPPISKFRGLKNEGKSGIPYYPLDMVVDAFEELRKDRKQEQIAILGHEMAAWVAMRYATKYPKNVSHLILVSTWPGHKAWSDSLHRVEAEGRRMKNPELEHAAKSHTEDPSTGKRNYEPKDPQEGEAMARAEWTIWWGDPRNIFAAKWYQASHKPAMGGFFSPEFELTKQTPNPAPVLLVHGKKSLWISPTDMTSLNKLYPNSRLVTCPNSADLPFVEDNDLFTKEVKEFFKKNPFKTKK